MVFLEYLIDNFEMVFELIGLLIMLGIGIHIPDRIKSITRTVVALLFAESIAYHLEAWTQTFETFTLLRPLLTAVVYSLYPLILIVMTKITTDDSMSRKMTALLLIPEAISIPLYLTSQWTHLVCWYSVDNKYQGGPLSSLPYFIFIFYSLVFLIENLHFFKRVRRVSLLASMYVTIVPLAGVVCLMFLGEARDYCALLSAAILLYFILVYIHMAETDPLTSLLNRYSYDNEAKKNITGVISIDMNGLKTLNDTEGHKAGDSALRTIAEILRKHAGPNASIYRIGGDEFVILYSGPGEREIVTAMEKMRSELASTKYSCSFGYAMSMHGESLSETISTSDSRMYKEKAKYYSELGNDRRKAGRSEDDA